MVGYCRNLFDKAESVADNDIIRDRIKTIRIPVDYLYVQNHTKQAIKDGTFTQFKQVTEKQKITWGYRRKRMTEILDDLERNK